MATNLQSRRLVNLGKRVVNQISYATARTSARRGVQTSVYDKNPEDHVRDSVVPDEVIEPQSDKYWAPHPQTGVFGPASDSAGGERGFHSSPATASGSILEQKTFFRPLEDLDKPPHA